MADAGRRNGSMRPVYAASLVTIIALLPVFLVGPMSVLMQHDLHFTDAQLGLGVSAYFAAASLAAVPNGRFAERLGARRTLAVSAAGSGIVLLGMTLAWSWAVIFACLAIGGVMNTLSQLGANLRLAGTVPMSRQGYAFGIKQAGPPVVTLFGGLAVPAVAIHFGWRWVFAAATTVAVITTAVMLLRHGRQAGNSRSGARPAISARAPLVVLGAAAGFATAANAATATFLVPYLVFVGIEAGTAGIVLAVASLAATAARVHAGWRADHRDGGNLLVIAAMLAIGAMSVLVLPLASGLLALAALAIIVYAIGWGWPGLFQLVIVRGNPQAPAAAGGITYIGTSGGGVLGPLFFGLLISIAGYNAAWFATAGLMAISAGLMLASRPIARRAWRPATEPASA